MAILADLIVYDSVHDVDTGWNLRELGRDVHSDKERLISSCQDKRDAMVLADLRAGCQLRIWEELVDLADLLHAHTLQRVNANLLHGGSHSWLLLLLHLLLELLLVSKVSRHLLLHAHHHGLLHAARLLHHLRLHHSVRRLHACLLPVVAHLLLLASSAHHVAGVASGVLSTWLVHLFINCLI